ERELIKILGKKDEAGRPMLYGTAPAFLELFSLESLKDLPSLREFAELNEESRETFEKATGEEAPRGQVLEDLEEATEAAGESVDESGSDTPMDEGRAAEPEEGDDAADVASAPDDATADETSAP